ncbi:MAG: metal-dependent hydrolase [Bacteroidota bacterium]
MKITYFGHSAVQIETMGKTLLFDPFISNNELASDIDISTLNPHYILLSHGHFDHVADAEAIAKQSGAKIISNYEIVAWYGKKDIEGHPMNHGGKWEFDFGTVWYVNAVHSSSLPDASYGGNPGGFVLHNEEGTIYFSGDTALTWDMKLIPMLYPKLDAAIFPIGDNFTMSYKDAVLAAEFVDCKRVIACHFDTFGFIKVDHERAKSAFDVKGMQLQILDIGASTDL